MARRIRANGRKTNAAGIAFAERAVKAMNMRRAGASYQAIADALGLKTRQQAFDIVSDTLKKTVTEPADELRKLEGERLDALIEELWPRRNDPRTADTILRAMARRAALLGLDAPTKLAGADGGDLVTRVLVEYVTPKATEA